MTVDDPDERTTPRDPAVLQRIQAAWPKVLAAEIEREQSTKNVLAELTAEAHELLEELRCEREEREYAQKRVKDLHNQIIDERAWQIMLDFDMLPDDLD